MLIEREPNAASGGELMPLMGALAEEPPLEGPLQPRRLRLMHDGGVSKSVPIL